MEHTPLDIFLTPGLMQDISQLRILKPLQMLLPTSGSGLVISLHHNSSMSVSTLTLEMVTEEDTGNYTCQPSNTRASSTTSLQVVDRVVGEELMMGNSALAWVGVRIAMLISGLLVTRIFPSLAWGFQVTL